KWGKCAKYVTGSMTVATNLDELNANNWVVSGWFNPDENNHGVSYPTWLSMDDQNTHGFGFDSTGRYGESDGPLFYLDTPPASGTWHWLAIVKYSGGLRFYLNGAFLNEISAQQRANFCSTLAIGGFAGTHAAGSTERTFSGLVDEVRLQYIPDDEITLWTGTSIAVPDAPYSKPQTVGEWGKFNKSELAMKGDLTTKADKTELLGKADESQLANYQPLLPVERQLPAAIADDHLIMSEVTTSTIPGANDDTVKFLLQPATSSNQVVDSAAGNTTPLEFTNNGVTADSDGVMTFSPTQYAVIPANTVSTGLIDILLNIPVVPDDDVKYVLFGSGPESNSGDGFYVVLQGGKLYFCPSDRAIMFLGNYTANTWVNITLGYAGPTVHADRNLGGWLDGTGHTFNLNSAGSNDTSGYVYTYSPFGHAFYLGKTDMSSTGLTWKAKVVRLRNTVEAIYWYPYNDTTTITVDDYPYQKTVQKVTKSWVRSTIAQLEAKMNVATASAAGLMAAADKAAIAGLTTHGIYPSASTKTGAVDFNEVIDHGMYFISGDTPHLNYPETYSQRGGTLQVIRNGNYLTQTFIPLDINKAFIRSCLNGLSDSSERTFSAWLRQLTDTDITESKARPGYFKLPGGTIVQWGAASNITADGSTQITFPVAFPNAFLIGNATTVSGNASASGVVVSLTAVTVTGMTLIIKNHPGNSNDINVHWLAIGY
ncbi:gp53-like domain-containing protein, partial [Victivallis vadensis]|uniref:gp53-like domain-containing protein n=1 Tax=Victivallis vadensis TaxID=172901 RepID=UPI0023F6F391